MYRDLEKRRAWYRAYYEAKRKNKSTRQMLLDENEKLKKENAELRKQVVLMTCPICNSVE